MIPESESEGLEFEARSSVVGRSTSNTDGLDAEIRRAMSVEHAAASVSEQNSRAR